MDTTAIVGCKVLTQVPKYLEHVKIGNNDKVIEMGTLSNLKKFMDTHKNFKDASNTDSMREDGRDLWSGVKNWDVYTELLDNGDEAVMAKVRVNTKQKVKELGKKYEEVLRSYKFDVTGQFFDVGLVLTGVPETWLELEPEMEDIEKVQVDIIINGTFNCGVDSKIVVEGGSRVLSMVQVLEDNGVQVNLKIVSCIKNYASDKGLLYGATNVKDYNEPVNYRKVSALISPTYLRRGMFKLMELCGKKKLSGGYGCPVQVQGFIDISDSRQLDALETRLFSLKK